MSASQGDESSSMAALSALNNATLATQPGQSFPIVTLKDGSKVPTGTVGALFTNLRAYDEAHAAGDEAKMATLSEAFATAIPLLKKIGFFELFSVDEWLAGGEKGKFGRQKVGEIAKSME